MCPHKLFNPSRDNRLMHEGGVSMPKYAVRILLFLFLFLTVSLVYAQNVSEEYLAVKNWVLPKGAVAFAEIKVEQGLALYQGKAFSGIAFERFDTKQLSRVVFYQNGVQEGLTLLWYPDGSPQMSAVYRAGALNGRFQGWYHNGSVIYDMMINNGAYAGDNLADSDESRAEAGSEDTEREGSDNDKTQE